MRAPAYLATRAQQKGGLVVEVQRVDRGMAAACSATGNRQRLGADLSRERARERMAQQAENLGPISRKQCRTEAVEVSEHVIP